MDFHSFISLLSVTVFASTFYNTVVKLVDSLKKRDDRPHELELEIDGKTIRIDVSSPSSANTDEMNKALTALGSKEAA